MQLNLFQNTYIPKLIQVYYKIIKFRLNIFFNEGSHVKTKEQLEEYVKNVAQTLYHPTSTCRMGSDDLSVVDEKLKVRGLKNLRVVDASIFPNIIGGHTHIPTIMVAEKISEVILDDAVRTISDDVLRFIKSTEGVVPDKNNLF